MKKFLLSLFLFQICSFAGVTGKLVGKVTDSKTGDPIIGANIVLEGTTLGAVSGVDGGFIIINIPPRVYRVSVSFIGYETVRIGNVQITVDQTTQLPVLLAEKSLTVNE
ncbi:MAG: carboxypeptidase-like regulatory domain-containing protein, partial [Ignavibacteriales bacterium]|nr:carboxypeptidase-like regulatory domain-containing protein [Ignavibacteriales bacterium]